MTAPDRLVHPTAIGILGGTFDPLHLAHLALACVARDRLGLAAVRWIPAGQPPHRPPPQATPVQRLAMVATAIAGDATFSLDDSEVACRTASYSVHTLERLRAELGSAQPLVLLMGADAFRGLTHWHRWRDILELAHLGVATRPGFPLDALAAPLDTLLAARRRPAGADFVTPAGTIRPFELVAGTVSATEVRARLAAAADDTVLRTLLPLPVLDYIRQHSLYRHSQ